MSLLKLDTPAAGTGTVSLQAPVTNNNRTQCLPDTDGTVQVNLGTLTNVVGSRALGSDYTNNTPRVRRCYVRVAGANTGGQCAARVRLNTDIVLYETTSESTGATWQPQVRTLVFDVYPGWTYRVENAALSNTLITWWEVE